MTTLKNGYTGLSFLIEVNKDWLISAGALGLALLAGAYFASQFGILPAVPRV